jgi:hypothetical protein
MGYPIIAESMEQTEGRMRVFIAFVIVAVALGYVAKSTTSSSNMASLLMAGTPAATTLSPHEIHINYNYKAMKELPVHDSRNAF